jgi:hypothetical protein
MEQKVKGRLVELRKILKLSRVEFAKRLKMFHTLSPEMQEFILKKVEELVKTDQERWSASINSATEERNLLPHSVVSDKIIYAKIS